MRHEYSMRKPRANNTAEHSNLTGVTKRRPGAASGLSHVKVAVASLSPLTLTENDSHKRSTRTESLFGRLRNQMVQLKERGAHVTRQLSRLYTSSNDVTSSISPVRVTSFLVSASPRRPLGIPTSPLINSRPDNKSLSETKTQTLDILSSCSPCQPQSSFVADCCDLYLTSETSDAKATSCDPILDNISDNEDEVTLTASPDKVADVIKNTSAVSSNSLGHSEVNTAGFTSLRVIDKCSLKKSRILRTHSPSMRINALSVKRPTKRRLSEDFYQDKSKPVEGAKAVIAQNCLMTDMGVFDNAYDQSDASDMNNTNLSEISLSKHGLAGLTHKSKPSLPGLGLDGLFPSIDTDVEEVDLGVLLNGNQTENASWFAEEEEQHIYENINLPLGKEMNVDGVTSRSGSPGAGSTGNGSPSNGQEKKSAQKLTAVTKSMEKIIRDLKNKANSGAPDECSGVKLSRSCSVQDMLTESATSESASNRIPLPSQLWGQISPPRNHTSSSPNSIKNSLYTLPKDASTPYEKSEQLSIATISWEPSFQRALPPSSTARQNYLRSSPDHPSAFRPYSKDNQVKPFSNNQARPKYNESVIQPNNCQYICMNKTQREDAMRSVSKKLFHTPRLSDMTSISIPEWPSNSFCDDADITLVAKSPSPNGNDSGRGSCASLVLSDHSSSSSASMKQSISEKARFVDDTEPIYETIGEHDTYVGFQDSSVKNISDLSLDNSKEHTYARIEDVLPPRPKDTSLRQFNLFERQEGEKKQENNQVTTRDKQCKHCSHCRHCPIESGVYSRVALRPDETIKSRDIVDMGASHIYTVADVLASMERLSKDLPEANNAPKARQNLYGIISDQKTRREISQALEMESHLKQREPSGIKNADNPTKPHFDNVDKYRTVSQRKRPTIKQQLVPNVTSSCADSRRVSLGTAPFTSSSNTSDYESDDYRTMPISQMPRFAAVRKSTSFEVIHKSRHNPTAVQAASGARYPQPQPALQRMEPLRKSSRSRHRRSVENLAPKNKQILSQAPALNSKINSNSNAQQHPSCIGRQPATQTSGFSRNGFGRSVVVDVSRCRQPPSNPPKPASRLSCPPPCDVPGKENIVPCDQEEPEYSSIIRKKDVSRATMPHGKIRPHSDLDTSVVSGKSGKSVLPSVGPFRRSRSVNHLAWKGTTVTHEIYC